MLNADKNIEDSKNQPLRRPKHSTSSNAWQYTEIPQEWLERRDQLLAITRETYLTKGKEIARNFQQAMQDNLDDANIVINLIYERAAKDILAYPIGALFFEELGQQAEDTCNDEIFAALQNELQLSLSSLNNSFSRMEKINGVDCGVIFLLYVLFRLENLRNGDGTSFKNLLLKLFKSFYPYALGSSKAIKKDLRDSAISAICLLYQVAFQEASSQKEKQKVEQTLGFLRYCFIHGSIGSIARIQVLFTIESINSQINSVEFKKQNYYQELYTTHCRKKACLLDSMDAIFSKFKKKMEILHTSKESLDSCNDSDAFLSPNEDSKSSSSSEFKVFDDKKRFSASGISVNENEANAKYNENLETFESQNKEDSVNFNDKNANEKPTRNSTSAELQEAIDSGYG